MEMRLVVQGHPAGQAPLSHRHAPLASLGQTSGPHAQDGWQEAEPRRNYERPMALVGLLAPNPEAHSPWARGSSGLAGNEPDDDIRPRRVIDYRR